MKKNLLSTEQVETSLEKRVMLSGGGFTSQTGIPQATTSAPSSSVTTNSDGSITEVINEPGVSIQITRSGSGNATSTINGFAQSGDRTVNLNRSFSGASGSRATTPRSNSMLNSLRSADFGSGMQLNSAANALTANAPTAGAATTSAPASSGQVSGRVVVNGAVVEDFSFPTAGNASTRIVSNTGPGGQTATQVFVNGQPV